MYVLNILFFSVCFYAFQSFKSHCIACQMLLTCVPARALNWEIKYSILFILYILGTLD